MAPGVIDQNLNAVRQPLVGSQLEAVVVAVCAGIQLRYRTEARVEGTAVRERCETALASGLIPVHLGLIGLVHRARSHILRAQIECCRSDVRVQSSTA